MRDLSALLAGILFGLGLCVAQMTNPQKVLDFLDISGNWDPSLALVMGGALVIAGLGFKLSKAKRKPLFANGFNPPKKIKIDRSLIIGAVLFGIGWGLIGLCPGPAIASLAYASQELLIFVVAMLVGMFISKRLS
ncbi:DUF6691 family protein [Neptunicella sp. SCSIO 80796]|uniref:DUF6691 family protein n=1 Tax=Neptunicella plasticusilytica TaxID=3117012 RepID=UPI003A4D3D52